VRIAIAIAIADDDELLLVYLRKLLTRLGHEVVAQAETGEELVERCRALHPDLVVSDVKMPGLDGREAARRINTERRTPVIFVSAHQQPQVAERSDYVVAWVEKPMKPAVLQAALGLV
jgi:CheY-like chemotaxis protein